MNNKNELRSECNTTNGMKDVLTDFHNEIVNRDGNNGTFNELVNGGVSLENNFEIKFFCKKIYYYIQDRHGQGCTTLRGVLVGVMANFGRFFLE